MGHLKATRVGWENERLAEFLLSRLTFIASPSKTSDDIGSDFICTLFREQEMTNDKGKKWTELFPTHSFAIQVKTGAPDKVDVSHHIAYLSSLEIPFFLGFVEQAAGRLTIYSCHHLPALFSSAGTEFEKLTFEPRENTDRDKAYADLSNAATNPKGPVCLQANRIASLTVNDDTAACESNSKAIAAQCAWTLQDLAAKFSKHHVFMLDREVYYTTAGVGSFGSFRGNLIESCIHITEVKSVDEMECDLTETFAPRQKAEAVAGQIKAEIRKRVGGCMTSSIGIAPNWMLAKMASDMQKPDGLVVLEERDIPGRLLGLKLQDFLGIGERMEARLLAHGIDSPAKLYAATKAELRGVWGGVEGERMYGRLRGEHIPFVSESNKTVGHSHVLPPMLRTNPKALAVLGSPQKTENKAR